MVHISTRWVIAMHIGLSFGQLHQLPARPPLDRSEMVRSGCLRYKYANLDRVADKLILDNLNPLEVFRR
jgi:hypothetical protein